MFVSQKEQSMNKTCKIVLLSIELTSSQSQILQNCLRLDLINGIFGISN